MDVSGKVSVGSDSLVYSLTMSKYMRLMLAFLIFSVFVCIPSRGIYAECRTARVSGAQNYPPLSWKYEEKLVGYSIHIVEKIFKELDVEVEVDGGAPWKRTLFKAQQGELDLLVGVRKSGDAKTYLHYIEPALTPAVQAVFMPGKNIEKYNGWADLEGKNGSMIMGASFGEEFDQYAQSKLSIEQAKTHAQNVSKLNLGRVDYIIGPMMPILMEAKIMGSKDVIASENRLIVIEEFLAFSQMSECKKHAAYFSKRLKELLQDGSADQLFESYYTRWFVENME